MSEVTKIYCDRCGNEITENNYYRITTPWRISVKVLTPPLKQKNYDLCEDCNKKLHEWLGIEYELEECK